MHSWTELSMVAARSWNFLSSEEDWWFIAKINLSIVEMSKKTFEKSLGNFGSVGGGGASGGGSSVSGVLPSLGWIGGSTHDKNVSYSFFAVSSAHAIVSKKVRQFPGIDPTAASLTLKFAAFILKKLTLLTVWAIKTDWMFLCFFSQTWTRDLKKFPIMVMP